MNSLDLGEEKVVRLMLRIKDPDLVSVTRISSSDPGVSGRIVDSVLEVKLAAGRPIGKFQEKLTLHTTSPAMPTVDVPVTGRVLGEIRLEPEAIGFQTRGRPDPAASPLSVMLSTVGQRPFKVTGLEDTTGFLEFGITEEQPGRAFRITVQLKRKVSEPLPTSFNGFLRISTDHPDQPVLELPVYRSGRMKDR